MNTIPFTEKDVKAYLDKVITYWRCYRDKAQNDLDVVEHCAHQARMKVDDARERKIMASYYIDAFQSVRNSLFGELLNNEYQQT